MTCHYLTEMGIDIFKDSIDTETARWHWIHVNLLAYDSIGARVQNCAPHLQ